MFVGKGAPFGANAGLTTTSTCERYAGWWKAQANRSAPTTATRVTVRIQRPCARSRDLSRGPPSGARLETSTINSSGPRRGDQLLVGLAPRPALAARSARGWPTDAVGRHRRERQQREREVRRPAVGQVRVEEHEDGDH